MNHTPAPWKIVESDLTIRAEAWGKSDQMGDYRGVIVCDFKSALSGPDCNVEDAKRARGHAVPEMEANMNLIAAAPELLELAEQIMLANEEGESIPQDIFLSARALIFKAKGVVENAND